MSIPAIHVHTQADKSTVPYAKFMWETMCSLANHPELLSLTVHCMGPTAEARAIPWIQRGNAIVIHGRKGDPLNGSNGHAACIASALAMTGDGAIHVICDSDTVVVAKGWDDYVRHRMLDGGIGMMGTTYEDLGGFSSGANTVQTYKKVPTFTWCALSPMHDWRDLVVKPNKDHRVDITTPQLSQIYNLPVGFSVFGEAGWQVPQYLHDHALSYEGWQQLKPTKDALVLAGLSDYHEEYHANGRIPIVTHHRGSMRHAYRGDRISNKFYGAVDKYLMTELTATPKWTWSEKDGVKVDIPILNTTPLPEPPKVTVTPDAYVPVGKEWLKISFNGAVVRPKRGVDRTTAGTTLEILKPAPTAMGHLRVEGVLEHNFPIVLPSVSVDPYMLTVRNMTGAPLLLTMGSGSNLSLSAGKTWWVLVDVDGVQRVE